MISRSGNRRRRVSPVAWLLPLLLVSIGLAARASDPPRALTTQAEELQPINPYPAAPPPPTFGDAQYRDAFDLSSMRKDAAGRLVAPLDDGRTAVLTIDPELQDAAE